MDDDDRGAEAARFVLPVALAARLDALLAVVADTLTFPSVRVNVLDEVRQHTVRMTGPGSPGPVLRADTLCDTVVRTDAPVVVTDAVHDPRFAGFPAVVAGEVGAYLGVPLHAPDTSVIGAICIVDTHRRTITAQQVGVLLQFGRIIERHLAELRADRDGRTSEPAGPPVPTERHDRRRGRRPGRRLDG